MGGAFDFISAAFEAHGDDLYGEDVTQLEHALQCADLAAGEGARPALIAAALLHDLGHLLDGGAAGVDVEPHEIVGAQALRIWLPDAACSPIALHVRAKRYLCAVDRIYRSQLSSASRQSLKVQGGPLTAAERGRFEAEPGFEDAVRLRRWDDRAKRLNQRVPPLASYRSLIESLAAERGTKA